MPYKFIHDIDAVVLIIGAGSIGQYEFSAGPLRSLNSIVRTIVVDKKHAVGSLDKGI